MSSLGDLLLGKIPEPQDVAEESDQQGYDDNDHSRDENYELKPKFQQGSPSDAPNEAHNGRYSAQVQKIFPSRIEKKRPEKLDDDRRSNASSTDDLVRELLDPNDRPRNVWHVVAEGTEQNSPVEDQDGKRSRDGNSVASHEHDDEVSGHTGNNGESRSDRSEHERSANGDRVREKNHDDKDLRSNGDRDRGRGRDRDRDRDRDDRDKDRDRDRHHKKRSKDHERDHRRRSSERHSKSHSKRGRISEDEDEDRGHKRHRSSHSRRHERRSRSRSVSRDSGLRRRRHRSRSADSRSPVTRHNSKTIFVMQLSPRVVSRDLEDFFEEIGRVKEVRLIMDSKTKRHKGIAYIEFQSASSAAKALDLNGQKFHGVPMQIQSALSEKSRGGDQQPASSSSSSHNNYHHPNSQTSSSHYTSSRSNLPPNSYRVYMGGLNVGITEDMLRTIVEPFGLVHKVELIKDRTTGLSRGYAFITYASAEDGQEAIRNLDGFELAGKSLRVSKSTEKSDH